MQEVLKTIVNTYPEVADIEDAENLPLPFAVYKIKSFGSKTKDSDTTGVFAVEIMLVCEEYGEMEETSERIKSAVLSIKDRNTVVVFNDLEGDFDGEDRAYLSTLNFTIKTF